MYVCVRAPRCLQVLNACAFSGAVCAHTTLHMCALDHAIRACVPTTVVVHVCRWLCHLCKTLCLHMCTLGYAICVPACHTTHAQVCTCVHVHACLCTHLCYAHTMLCVRVLNAHVLSSAAGTVLCAHSAVPCDGACAPPPLFTCLQACALPCAMCAQHRACQRAQASVCMCVCLVPLCM